MSRLSDAIIINALIIITTLEVIYNFQSRKIRKKRLSKFSYSCIVLKKIRRTKLYLQPLYLNKTYSGSVQMYHLDHFMTTPSMRYQWTGKWPANNELSFILRQSSSTLTVAHKLCGSMQSAGPRMVLRHSPRPLSCNTIRTGRTLLEYETYWDSFLSMRGSVIPYRTV